MAVQKLQRCENTAFHFRAAPFGTRSPLCGCGVWLSVWSVDWGRGADGRTKNLTSAARSGGGRSYPTDEASSGEGTPRRWVIMIYRGERVGTPFYILPP